MITTLQIEALAKDYPIDTFSIIREYLQLLWLSYLYQQKEADGIYFKGGTAIHLLFNSPRFSEDLDFSTACSRRVIMEVVKKTGVKLQQELPESKIALLYRGRSGIRFRWHCALPDFKYPLAIRLDFSFKPRLGGRQVAAVMTKFPLIFFPVISHLSAEEILAEKIRALLTRSKGRDVFDLWFLLRQRIKINQILLRKKLKEAGLKFNQQLLLDKVKNYSLKNLELDLNQFLPRRERQVIKIMKKELLAKLAAPEKR